DRGIGDGSRRAPLETQGFETGARFADPVGERGLAFRRAVERLAQTDGGADAHGVLAFEIVDVDDLRRVGDGEMDRLAGLLAQRHEIGFRRGRDVHLAPHQRAQFESREAEPIFVGFGILLEHARPDQGRGEAMHRALGESEALGEGGDAHFVLRVGEGLEQGDGVGDRGELGAHSTFHIEEHNSILQNKDPSSIFEGGWGAGIGRASGRSDNPRCGMLKREQNERLVRVGAGTPAGNLFRRYWQPALLSEELPEKDGAPQRVRMFGEDLVAFRDSNGRVGLVDAYCPHRRAPLFFGRNEECGLRCVYHGWKFDADGHCVDLPSEPETSPMKSRVTIKAYPTFEAGGMVWAYLGPSDKMPAKPDYEWMRVPATHRHVTKTFEDCNYLQALEGGLDTAHSSFLHNLRLGDNRLLRNRDGAPRIDVETTEYGYTYISTRKASEQDAYVRVYHYVMPFQQMRGNVTARVGGRAEFPRLDGHLWVPVDDEHTCVYNWAYSYDRSTPFTPDFIRF